MAVPTTSLQSARRQLVATSVLRRLATGLTLSAVVCSFPNQMQGQRLYDAARQAAERGQIDSAYDLISRAAKAEPDSAPVQF